MAGSGVYPLLLAESARQQGVRRLVAVAYKGETDSAIARHVDEVKWLPLGNLGALLDALKPSGIRHGVMVGQLTPTSLFRVRPDARLLAMLARLPHKNAETFYGGIAAELKTIGIELLPASMFMETHMPTPGVLTSRAPSSSEENDIQLGLKVAKTTSGLDIGQTVVLKDGVILAVEAFEGTNETIKRAGELGGAGCVIVKVAKKGHDMRFDIPAIGMQTMKLLKKVKAAALAVEARRSILLEREKVIDEANRLNMSIVAVKTEDVSE